MLRNEQQEAFRTHLREELLRRCKSNPRYSLRAYSKNLKVQSSFLSKLMNGKRSITPSTIERFTEPLGLSPNEVLNFQGKNTANKQARKSNLSNLTQDSFEVISDWYHFAILELFTVEGFKPTSSYISRRLGISKLEAIDALARLNRLNLIKKHSAKGFVLIQGENSTLNQKNSSIALRKLQKQVLEMAVKALEDFPIEQRDQSTMTMAIDSHLIPEAKERIKLFRRELCDFLQKNRKTDSVFQLSISLYPVTREIIRSKDELN